MAEPRPITLATLAPVIFSLILGGVIGIEIDKYRQSPNDRGAATGAPTASASGMSMGSGGGMGGGGGAGGGGGQPNSGRSLSRLVGTLATIEKVQGKGLTPDQEKKLQPIIESISPTKDLPEADAKTKLDAINAILTSDQTQMITDMTPTRGGRGGGAGGGGARGGAPGGPAAGGSGGRGAGGGGGPQLSMGGMGGGMGGGGQQDPNKPFASERAKKSLDDLTAAIKSGK